MIDLLSDVLTWVRLTGAVTFRIDVQGPWGIETRPTEAMFAPALPADTNNIIAFHIVVDGGCWLRRPPDDWFQARVGDAVVLPKGDLHELGDHPGRATIPFEKVLAGRSALDLRHERFETGEAPWASLVCGFLGCDRRAFEPLCNSLPPVFCVALGRQAPELLHYAATKALDETAGAEGVRARTAELLFMEALRLYANALPADATGWLAGMRDPLVGRALRALHAAPARSWSVETLAARTASSRSSLAARFRDTVGEPPMHYLTRLRMQLAARHLAERTCNVADVAEAVGYDSCAAFQRAFKRCFGVPPAAWRRRLDS